MIIAKIIFRIHDSDRLQFVTFWSVKCILNRGFNRIYDRGSMWNENDFFPLRFRVWTPRRVGARTERWRPRPRPQSYRGETWLTCHDVSRPHFPAPNRFSAPSSRRFTLSRTQHSAPLPLVCIFPARTFCTLWKNKFPLRGAFSTLLPPHPRTHQLRPTTNARRTRLRADAVTAAENTATSLDLRRPLSFTHRCESYLVPTVTCLFVCLRARYEQRCDVVIL